MFKIRLFRMGCKKKPFYRIVSIDAKKKRNGLYKDNIGYYNPLNKNLNINVEKINILIKNGAQLSKTVSLLLKKIK